MSDFWDGMAELDPELGVVADMYRKAAEDKKAKYEALEDALADYCNPDMLGFSWSH